MLYHVGQLSRPVNYADIVHLKDPAETEFLQPGDVVERWDHMFQWDDHCLKASQLEKWRSLGDPLCDAALLSMFRTSSASAGVDLLQRLEEDAAANPFGPSQAFLDEVNRSPPEDIAASKEEIRTAQTFFLRHSVTIMQSLLHFSLAGGFARSVIPCVLNSIPKLSPSSPRIIRVLQSVSYLVPPAKGSVLQETTPEMNDRTYSRLLETSQFVLDVMGCSDPGASIDGTLNCLDPGQEGWKAAVRVRLLHGIARRRIVERLNAPNNIYDVEKDGIPINQEDMAAT